METRTTRRTCRSYPQQNGNAAYDELFTSNNGHQNGYSSVSLQTRRIPRRADVKQRAQGKSLLAALKCENETAELTDALVDRLPVLSKIRLEVLKLGRNSIAPEDRAEITTILGLIGISDMGLLLKQLEVSMDRYIPRTKQCTGTPQSLKDAHNALAENITTIFVDYWSISLALGNAAGMDRLVRECFSGFLACLRHLPVTSQKTVLRLLATWCEFYSAQVLGDNVMRLIATLLPGIFRTSGDFTLQKLLAVILVCLYDADQKFLEDFACSAGFSDCLPDFCRLFRQPYDSRSQRYSLLPLKVANFLNERNGIHRRVFSFPITENSVAYQMSLSNDLYPVISSWCDGPANLLWQLNFSTSSCLLTFTAFTSKCQNVIVEVPVTSILFLAAEVDKSAQSTLLSFLLSDNLNAFIQDRGSSDLIGLVLGDCDRLCLHLAISQPHDLILLERALDMCFSSRKGSSDFAYELSLFPSDVAKPVSVKTNGKLEGTRLAETRTRQQEEEYFREALSEFKILNDTTMYEGRKTAKEKKTSDTTTSTHPSHSVPVQPAEESMDVTVATDITVSVSFQLPPGAILLPAPLAALLQNKVGTCVTVNMMPNKAEDSVRAMDVSVIPITPSGKKRRSLSDRAQRVQNPRTDIGPVQTVE